MKKPLLSCVLGSTRASVVSVVAAAASLLLIRTGSINSFGNILGSAFTNACYSLAAALAFVAFAIAAMYARNKLVLALGLPFLIAFHLVLNRIDPVIVSYFFLKDEYRADITKTGEDGPKFAVFDLSNIAGFPAGGVWNYIVFDSTDEIDRPASQRSVEWSRLHGAFAAPIPQCEIVVRHLETHFFYVKQSC